MPLEESRRQLHFADHRNAEFASVHQLRHVERDARADDDQVLIAKRPLTVLPGLNVDALIQQQRNLLAKLLLGLGIRDRDLRAALLQKQSAGHAGFPQPHHQHAFTTKVHLIRCRQGFHHGGTEATEELGKKIPRTPCSPCLRGEYFRQSAILPRYSRTNATSAW